MPEQLRDIRLWLVVLALLANAAAWLFGAGSKWTTVEYRLSHTEQRLYRLEGLLERIVEQQNMTARNLDVLTALVHRHMEIESRKEAR